MLRNQLIKITIVIIIASFFINPISASINTDNGSYGNSDIKLQDIQSILKKNSYAIADADPLEDVKVKVSINEIRALDVIDKHSDPDFFVKVIINDVSFKSPIYRNQKHISDVNWSCELDVPDDQEFVNITIQLWDWNLGFNTLCDIACDDNSNPDRKDLQLMYSIRSGHWIGDDMIYTPHSWSMDLSGYGRGNGCDDNSIYVDDNDCEIFFDITQSDIDHDGLPYWVETEVFHTDPTVNDLGRDDDGDGVPIEWEYKWGYVLDYRHNHDTGEYEISHDWIYDPFEYNDHKHLDPDGDSIDNVEEYLTSQWNSDPFRKDVFVELDQMQAGQDRQIASMLPEESKELITQAFNRQNIVFHLDDGSWEQSGSDMIPFDNETDGDWGNSNNELNQIYQHYFIDNAPADWRVGVFHYGVVIYQSSVVNGNAFGSNRYQISAKGMEQKALLPFPLTGNRAVVYASAYMHELGHSLGLTWLFGHDEGAYYPWQPLWWKSRPYRSIMNYGYMYGSYCNLIDYSDGSHGKNDFDDWSNIDYSYFENDF